LASAVHVDFTGRGYATACARALTQAGPALSDVVRVEIHTDETTAIMVFTSCAEYSYRTMCRE
jgi:hypothetical protein